jgi:hypothetical protein
MNGAPVAGIRVAALEAPTAGEQITSVSIMASLTQTDSSGRYRLEGIPPGRYYVVAGAVDFPTFFPGVPSPARATALTISRGATIDSVDIDLTSAGPFRVSGRVSGDRDSTYYLSLSGPEELTSEITPGGEFLFARVRPGAYTLRIIAGTGTRDLRGLAVDALLRLVSERGFVVSSLPIIVDDKDLTGLDIKSSTVRVTGRVDVEDDGPLASLDLVLTGVSSATNSGNISQDVRLNLEANGEFTATLPEGEYRVALKTAPDIYRVVSFKAGTADLLQESLRVSKTAPPILAVKFAVAQRPLWVKLSGRVTGLEFLPPDAMPRVILSGGVVRSNYEASVATDGSFAFPRVLRGTYAVTTTPGTEYVRSQTVVLESDSIDPLLVEVPIQKRITGRVVVEGGGPIPRLLLSFTSVKWGRNSRVPLEPGGMFSIVLPEGETLVRPFEPARADYTIKAVTVGSTNLLSEPLVVSRADSQEILVTITLLRSVRVAGRIGGTRALPADARVIFAGDAFLDIEAPIRPDRTFEFPKVLPGTYVLATIPEGLTAPMRIEVADRDLNAIEVGAP